MQCWTCADRSKRCAGSHQEEPPPFWAARRNEYKLEEWTVEGDLVREIVREVPWFQAWTVESTDPPEVFLRDIWRDSIGRLWVLSLIREENWRSGLGRSPSGGMVVTDGNRLYDSMLEVIDVARGEVIAARRFDMDLTFAGINELAGYSEAADGSPRIMIFDVILKGR